MLYFVAMSMTAVEACLIALLPVEGHAPGLFDCLTHQGVAADKLNDFPQMGVSRGSSRDLDDIHQHLSSRHLPQLLIQRTDLHTGA